MQNSSHRFCIDVFNIDFKQLYTHRGNNVYLVSVVSTFNWEEIFRHRSNNLSLSCEKFLFTSEIAFMSIKVDTWSKLNVNKRFIWSPGRHMNVLFSFELWSGDYCYFFILVDLPHYRIGSLKNKIHEETCGG